MEKPTTEEIQRRFDEYFATVESLVAVSNGDMNLIKLGMRDAFTRGYFEAMMDAIQFVTEKRLEKYLSTKPVN